MRNRNFDPVNNNIFFVPVFYHHTMENRTTIDTLMISPGEVILIEVYVLDNSGILDTANKTGALFMDSLTIVGQ